jgi:CheY-like chemotaxis protein
VKGDASQLQQVVMNLVMNGAEAIGEERGAVTVKTWLKEADETWLRPVLPGTDLRAGKYVVLEVTDTGCGMNEATLTKIFDPFFTTKFTGRGLGLAAVQGIVRSHLGGLTVDTAPGKGSRFMVLLPLPKEPRPPLQEAKAQEDLLRGSGHLLLVEDDEVLRQSAQAVLESHGYTVTVACDGEEAVNIFSRAPYAFDLVFADLTMTVMNGEKLFQWLQIFRPGVPVILTGRFQSKTALPQLVGNGLVGFLQKPYTPDELGAKIKAALSGDATLR